MRHPIGNCPSGEPKEVKQKWRRAVKEWGEILRPQDRDALLDYCRTWVQWDAMWRLCAERGRFLTIPNGITSTAPWAVEETKLQNRLWRLYREFGTTPSGHRRVVARDPTPDDPAEDLLT